MFNGEKPAKARPLRRVSSLDLNLPELSEERVEYTLIGEEVIPDSEEEQLRSCKENRVLGLSHVEVIEISSDEDDIPISNQSRSALEDSFIVKMPGAWPEDEMVFGQGKSSTSGPSTPSVKSKAAKKFRVPRSHRIIQSSDSEASEGELIHLRGNRDVIELIDSSPERQTSGTGIFRSTPTSGAVAIPGPEIFLPSYIDDDETFVDDGSILILNEPRSARKPVRLPPKHSAGTPGPSRRHELDSNITTTNSEQGGRSTPDLLSHAPSVFTPDSSSSKRRAPRQTKKSRAAEEQARRESYAQELFVDLNKIVFGDGLPKETKLKWSNRLLTTAGRARWHRSKEGVETSEIELAMKVLDSDERIRNTLSHEMCHLASWVINGELTEAHGSIWKGWATKVMRKRPDIQVSTKHSYDISHPYEWKCEQCSKIYGRFSKSIRPDECRCGACKIGKLVPLFSVSIRGTRLPKSATGSKMAAGKSQDSLIPAHRLALPPHVDAWVDVNLSSNPEMDTIRHSSPDPNFEVEELAETLGTSVHLTVTE